MSSSGPAGKEQYGRTGVYRQSGETHNNKPVWSRHDGTEKLFYDNGGRWLIGDPTTNTGGVTTADPAGDLWPHQVRAWKYSLAETGWESDPLLTVTDGPPPQYPDTLNVKNKTGDRANLAGVYRRQGDSRVWKYGDWELSFNGKVWCISGENLACQQRVFGWDYTDAAGIWPNTSTLYMIDYPASITVTSTGPAAEKQSRRMGRYDLDPSLTAQLRPVYKKTDRDDYIYYTTYGWWFISDIVNSISGGIRSEKRGLPTIPTSGWEYADGTCGAACWFTDPDLKFIYN